MAGSCQPHTATWVVATVAASAAFLPFAVSPGCAPTASSDPPSAPPLHPKSSSPEQRFIEPRSQLHFNQHRGPVAAVFGSL